MELAEHAKSHFDVLQQDAKQLSVSEFKRLQTATSDDLMKETFCFKK